LVGNLQAVHNRERAQDGVLQHQLDDFACPAAGAGQLRAVAFSQIDELFRSRHGIFRLGRHSRQEKLDPFLQLSSF